MWNRSARTWSPLTPGYNYPAGCTDNYNDGCVYAISVASDGKVYVGGTFAAVGGFYPPGGIGNNLVVWDPGTQTWSEIGGGVGEVMW